jgi:hypothetical protein
MRAIRLIGKATLLTTTVVVAGMPLYALPATLSLPPGPRPGIKNLTLSDAAEQLANTGQTDATLAESARALVEARMQYCRRNSFDSPARAFQRGYGYCTQQAYALADLLTQLGFRAGVVHAFRNQFPDGSVGGHAWVRVTIDGQEKDIDSVLYDACKEELTFTPLSKVLNHTPRLRILTQWAEAAVNAHRYYRTGKDCEL